MFMAISREQVLDAAEHYSEEEGSYDEEVAQLDRLPGAFAAGSWKLEDLEWIVDWKSDRFSGTNVDDLNKNPEARINRVIEEVLDTNAPIQKVEKLRQLTGVQTRMASAFLLFMNPSAYTVLDVKAWKTLQDNRYLDRGLSEEPDANDYIHYLGVCHALANEIDVELRTLDRAIWMGIESSE